MAAVWTSHTQRKRAENLIGDGDLVGMTLDVTSLVTRAGGHLAGRGNLNLPIGNPGGARNDAGRFAVDRNGVDLAVVVRDAGDDEFAVLALRAGDDGDGSEIIDGIEELRERHVGHLGHDAI